MNTLLVLSPYIGSIIVSLVLVEYALRRRRVPAAVPFSVVAASQALWTLGYIFELLAKSLDAKVEWDSAQYICEFSMTIAVVIMAREFRGDRRSLPAWLWTAWLFIPALSVIAFLSEPWHHLLRRSARILPALPYGALWYDFHWLDWVAAAWTYGGWSTAVVLLLLHARRGNRLVRRQALALAFGCLIPIVSDTVLVLVASPLPQRDPAPFVFLAGNLALGWGLFRAGLFELLPVAREILVQQMSDGVVVVDPHCRVIDANPAAESILEVPLSRMLGQHFGEISTRMRLELPNDCQAPATSKLLSLHDTERWYEITCHPVSDTLGASLGRLYVMHDVTAARSREFDLEARVAERTRALSLEIEQRKRTEAALAASEERFRAIFNQTFEAMGLLDSQGNVLDANQTALEFIGGDLQSLVGRPFWETAWWNGSCTTETQLRMAIASAAAGQFVRFETVNLGKDGAAHVFDFSLKPVKDETGQTKLLIPEGRDISEFKRLQSEQLELTAKLHQSQRLEALGRLAGGIAHDFNNLLTVIGGNLSLLQISSAHEDDNQFALSEAADATQRASALTRQLLTFSRQQIVEPRVFDPGQSLSQLRRLLQRILGEDILLSIEVAEDPLCLFMDTSQFEQIVMNLVVNARDAMRTGGRLDVSLERASTTLGGVQRNCALLTVSDTGTGIPESVVGRVFEPFFTTKAPGSGTGLGLATVHSIVTEASGTIAVQPGLERGTVFRIHLPLWEGALPRVESGVKPESLRVARGAVVVVEDQEPIRNLVVRILERDGFQVVAFADANAALEYARNKANPFNILLTDVVMPAMGGRALSDELGKLRPEVPVVFMSGHPGDMDLHQVAQGSGKYFIAKPFTPDNLSRTLSTAIEQGT